MLSGRAALGLAYVAPHDKLREDWFRKLSEVEALTALEILREICSNA
jgi:hypothetical protein